MKKATTKPIVFLIAPSSPVADPAGATPELNWQKLESVKKIFESQGFKVQYDKDIFLESNLPYVAAPKEVRLRHLKSALEDPNVKVIASLRGGYGCQEIIFDAVGITPSGPKILIGFSDLTAMHLLFNQNYNMPSIHGMVHEKYEIATKQIFALLNGSEDKHTIKPFNKMATDNNAVMVGTTVGGNLTLLASMVGTDLVPDFQDKIVILEDTGESGYKIHRMLLQLYNAGIIQKAKAIVFGDFHGGGPTVQPSIKAFIDEYLSDIPTYQTTGIGHKDWVPFILGSEAKISDDMLCVENPFSNLFENAAAA
jgi:muramoyltetrapeptide carboxypeptidase